MSWTPYTLDQEAQKLVLAHRDDDVLQQSHKMRQAVAFGLERFWGEHLRLREKESDKAKAKYWKATWDAFVGIMKKAGLDNIPNDAIDEKNNTGQIKGMSEKLWKIPLEDQCIALAVLTQLCDCLVWWTQRYRPRGENNNGK
jgi:hypothetical protein